MLDLEERERMLAATGDLAAFDAERTAAALRRTALTPIATQAAVTPIRAPIGGAEARRGHRARLLAGVAAAAVVVAGLAAAFVTAGRDTSSTVADSAAAPLERTLQAQAAPATPAWPSPPPWPRCCSAPTSIRPGA